MTHRIEQPENRECVPSRAQQTRATWLLLAILGLAFGLRVWGIGFGLPYQFHMDEIHEVVRALKLGAGEYHWAFGKGGLYYILFVENVLLYIIWWTIGRVNDTHEFALQVLRDPSTVFLLGRLTVAMMGVLTCLVIFQIGRRVYDWRVGLGAAIIGATAYNHGVRSHIINVDIGMTLALWASILAYLEYEKNKDRRWLMGAGVLGGVAIAFKLPGAIVLLPLLLAIGSRPERWQCSRQMLKEAGIVLLTTLVTLTVVAPEWTTSAGYVQKNFSLILGQTGDPTGAFEGDIREAIPLLQKRLSTQWTGYFKPLLKDYNLTLSISALLGACFGLFRRRRWDIIWIVVITAFLAIMSAANRPVNEHYLMPIMPALWLLSSQAIAMVSRHHLQLGIAGLTLVVILPLVALVRTDYEWTKPDTRILAKDWMESNVPAGAKILMDGSRFRFIQSVPLTPDKSTVAVQLARAGGKTLSRGISNVTLSLYAEAMEEVKGPRYELHSTIYGLAVKDPTYYVHECFDYIITSSIITRRYARKISQKLFPESTLFYQQLKTDPRFKLVYSGGPIPWESDGPTIKIYKVLQTCEAFRTVPKLSANIAINSGK